MAVSSSRRGRRLDILRRITWRTNSAHRRTAATDPSIYTHATPNSTIDTTTGATTMHLLGEKVCLRRTAAP